MKLTLDQIKEAYDELSAVDKIYIISGNKGATYLKAEIKTAINCKYCNDTGAFCTFDGYDQNCTWCDVNKDGDFRY